MGILTEDFFQEVEQYFRIELYGKDGLGKQKPRVRIEMKPMPSELTRKAVMFTMPCVCCGEPTHPFRLRAGKGERGLTGHMYFAPTCELRVKIGCSRGTAAKEEYKAVRLYFGV